MKCKYYADYQELSLAQFVEGVVKVNLGAYFVYNMKPHGWS